MRSLVVCLALAGCARAGPDNRIVGGLFDAQPGDAAPDALGEASGAEVTLSQTTSSEVVANNSLGCTVRNSAVTRRVSYYRVFPLAEHGVTTALHVRRVAFGVQSATAGSGTRQPATVRIGTYGGALGQGTLDLAQIQVIASVDIAIDNQAASAMTVAIGGDIAPGASVIAELAIPDGVAQGHKFVIGSNAAGERRAGYTLAPDCGFSVPTSMQRVAAGQRVIDVVMTVSGTMDAAP